MPPRTQRPAQVIPAPNPLGPCERNPPGPSEVHPSIIATGLTIRIPPETLQFRRYLIALANISNEDFATQYCFKQEQWESAPPPTRIAWRAFYEQFVRVWTAFPEFASGHASGGYLYCTAGSHKLNTTVLFGCGMACVACNHDCATGERQCVTRGHMGTRNAKMLLTSGFGLCNMCSKFHMDDPPVERMQDGSLRSGTGAVFQLWVRRVKLDRLARQQINHIDRVYPVGMGSYIPVIQYMGVSYTKLSSLFEAMEIRQAGALDNVISSQAVRQIIIPLDPQRYYSLRFADFHVCFHDFKLNIFSDLNFISEAWKSFQHLMDRLDEVRIPGC